MRVPHESGKHRTEATEVTEGELGLVAKNSAVKHRGFRCEYHTNPESIAQRPQRSQRGIGIGGQKLFREHPELPVRRTQGIGKGLGSVSFFVCGPVFF